MPTRTGMGCITSNYQEKTLPCEPNPRGKIIPESIRLLFIFNYFFFGDLGLLKVENKKKVIGVIYSRIHIGRNMSG